ncbi:probable serine/threonine-protein kinase SIS8 [Selaginella moellendorffii]|nr:probable serine/threonine-protein kinase SIS8 [Selaginella moellendorffii]XP_024515381.1 probable serine/threonine-protein kinase SIS8 [Selaginella moellendorffii]|eukprot:XP_002962883.2 probable serine/threonine-protein kinase SIS8 [Selaginella moellendorffii]
MKNLLRKLHIGNDHYDRLDEERTSPDTTPTAATASTSSSSSTSPSPFEQQRQHSGFSGWLRRNSRPPTPAGNGNPGETGEGAARAPVDLGAASSMLTIDELQVEEEEYQVQLALALSASKSDSMDPEIVEIEAAKRISLGLSPSPDNRQAEVLTGRYWAYNVLNYDDKVVDGFYDIYGLFSPLCFEKIPSLEELQETEVSESVNFEVILVNRVIDLELGKLEQRAMCISSDCSLMDRNPIRNGLANRIAELVVEALGGVVVSDIDILTAWKTRGWELRSALQNVVWPLGMLGVGLARHRALLFKVLADCVNLPCRLVKGNHYTGVEDGVLNILKADDGREFIIDLMGAPGTLIPLDATITSYSGSLKATTANKKEEKLVVESKRQEPGGRSKEPFPRLTLCTDASQSQSGHAGGGMEQENVAESKIVAVVATGTIEDDGTVNSGLATAIVVTEVLSCTDTGACKSSLDNNRIQKSSPATSRNGYDSPRKRVYSQVLLEDAAEWEINWEDINIGERVGIGSYGEVYHGEWSGTEVAVKKFLDQDFSGDAMMEFRSEVQIMRGLKHPNVVLFMGAVAHPPNLAIVTEYLPRGSLFKLLHRPHNQLDRRRRLQMALDVAEGMNYLHSCKPVIVHRDLKSPNLLVDRNWVVKVCDFGLSRIKHSTFLSSKSTAGTPEWMAPEVLRNEPSNEKSDVFSFGVILWELATSQKPWHGMNPMQVVGAVGFQHRRLPIPPDVDPSIASIIQECWQNDPSQRPSFEKILNDLQALQRPVLQVNQPSSLKPNHQLKMHYQQQLHAVPLKGVAFNVESVGSHVTHINALEFAVRAQVP